MGITYWIEHVKREMRDYICRELRKQDIIDGIQDMEDDVSIATSQWSATPRSKTLPVSPVEREVENRESSREFFNDLLKRIDEKSERLEKTLDQLEPIEFETIKWAYMRVNSNTDGMIAKQLGLSLEDFWKFKYQGLASIHEALTGEKPEYDLERLLKHEHKHYTRSRKMDGEKPEPITRPNPVRHNVEPVVRKRMPSMEEIQSYLALRDERKISYQEFLKLISPN